MNMVIETRNLNHHFGDNKVLNNINLNITEGEIFGLLGPSGAGKTTLIKILTGQLKASGGSCHIMGTSSSEMSGEGYKQIGNMMGNIGLCERMSCYDNLKFYQMLDNNNNINIELVLENINLLAARKTPVMNLSKGMKNRLAFARAILRTPKVLFLDEPTSGLDPKTVEAIHEMILVEKERGTTVFLTTHNMYEAEKLCDNIALLNKGKIVEYGTPSDICRRYNHQKKINIHLKNGSDITLEHNKENGVQIQAYFSNDEVETIHSTEPNLETIFMELTGRRFEV